MTLPLFERANYLVFECMLSLAMVVLSPVRISITACLPFCCSDESSHRRVRKGPGMYNRIPVIKILSRSPKMNQRRVTMYLPHLEKDELMI